MSKPKKSGEPRMSDRKKAGCVDLAAEGFSDGQISERLAVAQATVREWLRTEEAKALVVQAREERVARSRARLERLADAAIGTLGQALVGTHESKVRVAAADSVLDRVGLVRGVRSDVVTKASAGPASSFSHRTDAELRHYVEHGRWPEEGA